MTYVFYYIVTLACPGAEIESAVMHHVAGLVIRDALGWLGPALLRGKTQHKAVLARRNILRIAEDSPRQQLPSFPESSGLLRPNSQCWQRRLIGLACYCIFLAFGGQQIASRASR